MALTDSSGQPSLAAQATGIEVAGTTPLRRRRVRPLPLIGRIVLWLLLIGFGLLFLYPFAWLLAASLKPRGEVFDNALIPHTLQISNYATVWDQLPLISWLVNSLAIAVLAAGLVTVSSSLVAFGFAYFRFPGRRFLFGIVLATMMLPGAVTLVPQYLIWKNLGLIGTWVPLFGMNLFGSAFYIFLLRQFFLGLPRDMFEAARVDGASYWRLFWRIALPLCRPALVVTFIFEFRASWTDLIKPLIYLRRSELYTLPRGLKAILDQFGQGGEMKWEVVAAASECEAGRLHLWPEAGVVEVLADGRPAGEGEPGELVCTGLLNKEMPLVRYRVGDRGARAVTNGKPCACGRTLPVLASVEGRIDDLVYTPDGRRVGCIDTIYDARLPVREAQIVQEALDRVRVRYVPAPGFTAEAGGSITRAVRDRMGAVEVVLESVDEIPRGANGKYRAVVCQLPAETRRRVEEARS